jgi:hypothetical protein
VFVLEEHRGKGLSKWLMEVIAEDSRLAGFRRWMLATRDAHGLYAQSGFVPLSSASRWMEKRPLKGYVEGARTRSPLPESPRIRAAACVSVRARDDPVRLERGVQARADRAAARAAPPRAAPSASASGSSPTCQASAAPAPIRSSACSKIARSGLARPNVVDATITLKKRASPLRRRIASSVWSQFEMTPRSMPRAAERASAAGASGMTCSGSPSKCPV